MTKLPEEYEGDIYRYSHEGVMGPYLCDNDEGDYGIILFHDYDLFFITQSLLRLSEGSKNWAISPVDEYVVPKEFLM